MPLFSERGRTAYQSPIRKLVPFANAAKERGVKIYHLNIGQPDLVTPKAGMDKVRNTDLEIISYSPSKGIPSYLNKLTHYYKRYGLDVQAEDIFVTTGASEAVIFTLMACADRDYEVIIPEPFYANYTGFCEMAGVVVAPIQTHLEDNFDMPSVAAFEAAITSKTKAIFICNPGNPTGKVFSMEELRMLGGLCKKYDLFFIIDEVYREFCYDGKDFISGLSLDDLEDRVVVIDSISKRFSACGARVGAIVCKNKELHEIINKFAQLRLSTPTFGQILAEGLLDLGDDYYEEVNQEYDKRRTFVLERLSKMRNVKYSRPNGAFYIMVDLPVYDSDHFCQWLLETFHMNGETVMLAPASGFYANKELGKSQIRIAYILNVDDLAKAMDCLEHALASYPDCIELEGTSGGVLA